MSTPGCELPISIQKRHGDCDTELKGALMSHTIWQSGDYHAQTTCSHLGSLLHSAMALTFGLSAPCKMACMYPVVFGEFSFWPF